MGKISFVDNEPGMSKIEEPGSEGARRPIHRVLHGLMIAGLFAGIAMAPLILQAMAFRDRELSPLEAASLLARLGDRITSTLIGVGIVWLASSVAFGILSPLSKKKKITLFIAGLVVMQAGIFLSRVHYEGAVRQHLPEVMERGLPE